MNPLRHVANRIRSFLLAPLQQEKLPAYDPIAAMTQRQIMLAIEGLVKSDGRCPPLTEMGFKVFSQADEDGILLYIFSIIGTTNKMAVEMCAGDGIECNTANLIVNHGWHGLLIDGSTASVERGANFYKNNAATRIYPPKFISAWVTKETVNDLLKKNDFTGEIDLLSIDMDGVDYWIWKEIEIISPRVVVVEYQDILGPDRSLTVPYSDTFNSGEYSSIDGMPNFAGASLLAYAKLAETKGYRLIGCNRYGYNAFFIKKELGAMLPTVSVADCFSHPKVQWGMKHRYPAVKDHPWVKV